MIAALLPQNMNATLSKTQPTVRIEVHVALIDQLFNSIDPSPFHTRDLDTEAESYIFDTAKELPKHGHIELVVHLDKRPGFEEKLNQVDQAIRSHFAARARSSRQLLSDLFKRGRISLLIGLTFLSLSIGVSNFGAQWLNVGHAGQILRESVLIGGWVAMWRPMEIFLYDWWPIRARIRLLNRLARMSVRIVIKHPAGTTT